MLRPGSRLKNGPNFTKIYGYPWKQNGVKLPSGGIILHWLSGGKKALRPGSLQNSGVNYMTRLS